MARIRFGLTWWGQRWVAALEALGALYANRMPRGRTYARKGTVTGLEVRAGEVVARVQGSRVRPYRVRLRLPTFDDGTWDTVTAALAGKVRYAAALLDGRMPEDVDDVLAGVGVSLFPGPGDLDTSCSCPDWANPCKHVAAVHYVLAQAFDADPFLLPALRGRDRETLLAGLRAARGAGRPAGAAAPADEGAVPIADLRASTLWDARGDLDAVGVRPAPPGDPAAPLRGLGPPPGFQAGESLLTDLVTVAADTAWRLVSGQYAGAGDEVLAALRERGSATSRDIAGDLGWQVTDVRARLRLLLDAGLAHRTGHARSTRYHA